MFCFSYSKSISGKYPFIIFYSLLLFFFSGRDPLIVLTSHPFLSSGRDFILRANIILLYSAFYYYTLFSGYNFLVVLTSYLFLFLGRDFIFWANTLLLYSAFYYYSFSLGRNLSIILTSRPFLG
jgi:hypothetical protein